MPAPVIRADSLLLIALACCALAWSGIGAAYIASAMDGHVPWCVPFVSGCDSISATGRHGWGYFMFKATMLPAAALGAVYWYLCGVWLRACGSASRVDNTIVVLGVAGALFLALYVTFLGSDGDIYRLMRRYGTVGYFGCTFLAQLLLSRRAQILTHNCALARAKVWLGLGMLIGGIVFAGIANLAAEKEAIQNVSEWLFAAGLTGYPVLTWLLWRQTHFTLEAQALRTRRGSSR